MIPKESIKFNYETIRTDELGYARLREAQRQYNTTREDENNSFWGQINAMQENQVNKVTGKSANQNLKDIESLSGQALINAMQSHYQTYGSGAAMPGAEIKKDKNGVFMTVIPASQTGNLKTVANTNEKKFEVKIYNKSTKKWSEEPVLMTAREISASKQSLGISGKGMLSDVDKENFGDAADNMWVRQTEYQLKDGYKDANGKSQYLKADGSNVKEYNASKVHYRYNVPIEKAFTRKREFDEKTKLWVITDTPLPGFTYGNAANINNPADAMWMDVESNIKPAAAANTAGETSSTVTISSGSSTTNEP
jgi:hypothetical protein